MSATFVVHNVNISAAGFVQIPVKRNATQLLLKSRDGANILVSGTADGASYITIPGALSVNFSEEFDASTACDVYVKGTTTTVLEVLMAG